MKPLVIYHSVCADGFTAAWVAWRHFNGEVDLHPGVYSEAAPDCVGRDVYILDFSYPPEVMEKIIRDCASLAVLDHHETAMNAMAEWAERDGVQAITKVSNGGKYREILADRTFMRFDMTKSGALLTWEHFNPEEPQAPKLVQYVSDRDLWKFELPHSRAIAAWVFSYEYTMENWNELAYHLERSVGFSDAASQGGAIERKHFKDINEFIHVAATTMLIDGLAVPVLNCPYQWASDAGHILSKGQPFAATYYETATQRVWSLRSAGDGLNVAEIAKKFGGGGHAHAAGFRTSLEESKTVLWANK